MGYRETDDEGGESHQTGFDSGLETSEEKVTSLDSVYLKIQCIDRRLLRAAGVLDDHGCMLV